jgi:hypothetical protein
VHDAQPRILNNLRPCRAAARSKGFHRRRGYGGQGILNSKAPIAEILFMEQLGEIGQRVHMMVES